MLQQVDQLKAHQLRIARERQSMEGLSKMLSELRK
jgi:hypothetical protein